MNSKLHIAIIPDGNRRWAKAQGQPAFFGHQHGAQNFMKILEAAAAPERGIYAVTIWALSTENVRKRSETELAGIWKLLTQIEKHLPDFHKHGVRFRTLGDLAPVPARVAKTFEKIRTATENNTNLVLNLAVNYGGADEIRRILGRAVAQNLSPENLDPPTLLRLSDLGEQPAPDLIIRTGEQSRLSGFLPLHMAYSELYFSDKMWPAFTESDLDEALAWFRSQKRNFGK